MKIKFYYRMKKHETHLPTKQITSKENHWIPRSHENRRRPQGHQPQTPSRSQKTGCLDFPSENRQLGFPKENRLRSRRDFLRVGKGKKRLVGRFFCLDYRVAARARVGISVAGRYGSAPERNRFKRLIREAFRIYYGMLPPVEFNVIPRQDAKGAALKDVSGELIRLLHEAK